MSTEGGLYPLLVSVDPALVRESRIRLQELGLPAGGWAADVVSDALRAWLRGDVAQKVPPKADLASLIVTRDCNRGRRGTSS